VNKALEQKLDLQAAADELGVHYQTAYRWVRSGVLQANLVGAAYVINASDVRALAESRSSPRKPPTPTSGRLDHAAGRLYDSLVAGDELATRRHVRKLVAEGASITAVIQDGLVPPLRRIGQDWYDGKIAIWTEHRASSIVERLLGEFAPNPRGRRRGVAMVVAVSGDRHSLPTTMAAVALRDDNWHVQHLGADTPPEQILEFCEAHDITLAVISMTNQDVARLATSTAGALRAAGTPTIVGGPGRTLLELVDEARQVGAHRPKDTE
jgi:excisionase family DNA binding protein